MREVLEKAKSLWGEGKQTGNPREWKFRCPLCQKMKLYIDVESGLYLCFKCYPQVRGNLNTQKVSFDFLAPEPKRPNQKVVRNWDWHPINFPPSTLMEQIGYDYLVGERGLTRRLIGQFKIGVSYRCLAISIPVGLVNILRLLYDANSKYVFPPGFVKKRVLFNFERVLITNPKRVFVFEGVFDVICAAPNESVAVFGSSISDFQASLLNVLSCSELVLCFDPDVDLDKQLSSLVSLEEKCTGKKIFRGILPKGLDPGELGNRFTKFLQIRNIWDLE